MSEPYLLCHWSVTCQSSGTLTAAVGCGGRMFQELLYSSFCSGLLLHSLFYKCTMPNDRAWKWLVNTSGRQFTVNGWWLSKQSGSREETYGINGYFINDNLRGTFVDGINGERAVN